MIWEDKIILFIVVKVGLSDNFLLCSYNSDRRLLEGLYICFLKVGCYIY